jgi:hypothetical protein
VRVFRLLFAAALACAQPVAAAAHCGRLDGTYRAESVERTDGEPERLADLTFGPERRKLYRMDDPGHQPAHQGGGLAGDGQPRSKMKITHLASTVTLAYAPAGTRLRFMDAGGKLLAESRIDAPRPWECAGDRLVRRSQHTGGLGDNIRTEQVEESLERDAAGALVHRESVTVIEGGHGTRSRIAHYPAAQPVPR